MSSSQPPPQVQIRAVRSGPMWAKLFSLAVIANAVGVAATAWIDQAIRRIPETDGLEQGLRTGYFLVLALVALFDALLLDEWLFGGAFRRTHFGGRKRRATEVGAEDEAIEAEAASMQRSHLSFPFLVVAAAMVTHQLYGLVTRDFETYYRDVGQSLGDLRRGDDARRIAAIQALSLRRSPEIVPALSQEILGGGKAAPWAAWALGRHRDLKHRRSLILPLMVGLKGDDAALRRESAVALGRLQHRPVVEAIQDELRADLDAFTTQGQPIDLRLLYALGAVQVTSSAAILGDVLQRGDAPAQAMAAWALAQHRDQRGAEPLVHILEDRLATADVHLRCALVHALGIFAHESSNLALIRAYDDSTEAELNFVCPRVYLGMAPDRKNDVEELFLPDELLALKILGAMGQMRATSPEVRAVVEPWLERRIADPEASIFIQEGARALLKGIRTGQDDRTKPSVDELLGR